MNGSRKKISDKNLDYFPCGRIIINTRLTSVSRELGQKGIACEQVGCSQKTEGAENEYALFMVLFPFCNAYCITINEFSQ